MVKLRKNQKGQLIVEAILIIVIFLGVSRFVANSFKQNEYISKIIKSPWTQLSNLIENGKYHTEANQARNFHPNYNHMHVSLEGDQP